ncbi:DUF1641 domain-containing protein [Fervidibacillus halotolerans]|uniref:DUF1641 domain-containing protein n=1 Tax=Fervidibacillus halotolerans TaxID=2980027 RepID=A0A9E8M096_9BACI|nr:DUF1641 domain-containing protein [Fervidibacillus halotolerans]WAA13000.1 DUF1641 domain-containing protein [Fervidibacillus halotolerans]
MSNVLEDQVKAKEKSVDERELLDLLLKPEVQQSLTALVEQLPKLNELVQVLTKYQDIVQSLASDEILKREMFEAMRDTITPAKQSIQQVAQNVIEAKEAAEKSEEVIGLFGLLKMIKDPQAQKLFRFINAYLKIVSEKEEK